MLILNITVSVRPVVNANIKTSARLAVNANTTAFVKPVEKNTTAVLKPVKKNTRTFVRAVAKKIRMSVKNAPAVLSIISTAAVQRKTISAPRAGSN
jgi:hypothetical protein